MLGERIKVLLETTRRLSRRGASQALTKILNKTHTADLAVLFRFYDPRERKRIFSLFTDLERKAEVIGEMDTSVAVELLAGMPAEQAASILQELEYDDSADIVASMPENLAAELLARMETAESEQVEALMGFNEDTAGGLMSTHYFALDKETTAGEAIAALQKAEDVDAFYVYVINEYGHLVGVLSLRQLVRTPPTRQLKEIMIPDVISVTPGAGQDEVARIVERYNFLALPVVDESNKLLGLITVDDVIDVITEEATRDVLKMAGAGEELPEETTTLRENLATRFPWLLMTCIGGLLAALLIHQYLDKRSFLGFVLSFCPLLLGMARNIGNQSATLVARGLDTGQFHLNQIGQILMRELAVGIASGAVYGAAIGGVAVLMYHTWGYAIALASSVVASMIVAVLIGTMAPFAFAKLGGDPTQARTPLTMTAMDIVSVVLFLAVARVLAG